VQISKKFIEASGNERSKHLNQLLLAVEFSSDLYVHSSPEMKMIGMKSKVQKL
jgi:hypothetical protein